MIEKKECLRCGKSWYPRAEGRPALCPFCRTAKWDEPKADNEPGAKRKYNVNTPKMGRGADGKFKKLAQ